MRTIELFGIALNDALAFVDHLEIDAVMRGLADIAFELCELSGLHLVDVVPHLLHFGDAPAGLAGVVEGRVPVEHQAAHVFQVVDAKLVDAGLVVHPEHGGFVFALEVALERHELEFQLVGFANGGGASGFLLFHLVDGEVHGRGADHQAEIARDALALLHEVGLHHVLQALVAAHFVGVDAREGGFEDTLPAVAANAGGCVFLGERAALLHHAENVLRLFGIDLEVEDDRSRDVHLILGGGDNVVEGLEGLEVRDEDADRCGAADQALHLVEKAADREVGALVGLDELAIAH